FVQTEQVGHGAVDDAAAADAVDGDERVARGRLHQNLCAARLDALIAVDLTAQVRLRLTRRYTQSVVGLGRRAAVADAEQFGRETFHLRGVEDDGAALLRVSLQARRPGG